MLPGWLRTAAVVLVSAVAVCACGTAPQAGPQSAPNSSGSGVTSAPGSPGSPASKPSSTPKSRLHDPLAAHKSAPAGARSTPPGRSGSTSSPGGSGSGPSPGRSGSPGPPTASGCQATFVPAYFYASNIWAQAINTRPAPAVMLLNVDNGVGTAPLSHFQTLVRQAHDAGITVLGYSSTSYGQRAVGSVETEVREYESWYGVNGIFLDLTQGTPGEFSYYRTLADFIRSTIPNGVVWLNPGDYPDPSFMSIANVVMVFEGPYSSYVSDQIPSWISQYSPSQFAHVIYETPPSDLGSAVSLSRERRAGHLFVTDLSGAGNPYGALPSYWSQENGAITGPC